jgi:hypothetical protein
MSVSDFLENPELADEKLRHARSREEIVQLRTQVRVLRVELEQLREAVLVPLDALIGDLEEVAAKSEMAYAPAILKKLADVRYPLSNPEGER